MSLSLYLVTCKHSHSTKVIDRHRSPRENSSVPHGKTVPERKRRSEARQTSPKPTSALGTRVSTKKDCIAHFHGNPELLYYANSITSCSFLHKARFAWNYRHGGVVRATPAGCNFSPAEWRDSTIPEQSRLSRSPIFPRAEKSRVRLASILRRDSQRRPISPGR